MFKPQTVFMESGEISGFMIRYGQLPAGYWQFCFWFCATYE